MLNSNGNENDKENSRSNKQKKTVLQVQHTFAHFFIVVLHNQNMTLPSYMFQGENVIFAHKKCCCLCCCSFFSLTAACFSCCWPLPFRIFSLQLQLLNFQVILPAKFVCFNLFFLSHASSLSVIHVTEDIKMYWKKDLPLLFFFPL